MRNTWTLFLSDKLRNWIFAALFFLKRKNVLKYKIAKTDTGFWKNTNNFFVAENFFLYTEGKKKQQLLLFLSVLKIQRKTFDWGLYTMPPLFLVMPAPRRRVQRTCALTSLWRALLTAEFPGRNDERLPLKDIVKRRAKLGGEVGPLDQKNVKWKNTSRCFSQSVSIQQKEERWRGGHWLVSWLPAFLSSYLRGLLLIVNLNAFRILDVSEDASREV